VEKEVVGKIKPRFFSDLLKNKRTSEDQLRSDCPLHFDDCQDYRKLERSEKKSFQIRRLVQSMKEKIRT